MSRWYRTAFRAIEAVDVEHWNDTSVWIGGRRRTRVSAWQALFPTWQEAHAHLLAEAELKLIAARRALELAQGEHGNIKGMKEPPHD